MAASLQIIVNNDKNTVTLCDNYGVEITLKCKTFIGVNAMSSIFANGIAQVFYTAYFSECDIVSFYNGSKYICCLENEIHFEDLTATQLKLLSE